MSENTSKELSELRRQSAELAKRIAELEKQGAVDARPAAKGGAGALPNAFADPLGQQFAYIPPGAFTMGNVLSSEELVRRWGGNKAQYDAAPQRPVTISKGFYLCRFPVQVGAFARFVGETGCLTTATAKGKARVFCDDGSWRDIQGAQWSAPGFPQTPNRPVVCVSWFDAMKFVEWLNANFRAALPSGFQYALPTETEWERACRAGTATEFFWGTNEARDGEGYLNAADETGAPNGKSWDSFFPFKSDYAATSPVGSFKPNAWGLYDMLGNVGEWCADGLGKYSPTPSVDPVGPLNGATRAVRGGAWCNGPAACRSGARGASDAYACSSRIGFRLAIKSTAKSDKSDAPPASSPEASSPAASVSVASVSVPNASPNAHAHDKTPGSAFAWTINGVETVFRRCPAGTFTMGSPTSEEGRNPDETQREVTLSKGFWILETPVTQELWKAVEGNDPSFFKGDDLPVERVSWKQCVEFIARLNEEEGLAPDGFVFDLPTEAEWEYAARAESTTPYYFGEKLEFENANFGENIGKTTSVKTYLPNVWGLYDLLGNVGEWCSDWRGAYPDHPETDPIGAPDGSKRVFRGGGWCYGAAYCRAASRNFDAPDFRANRIGFRLVMRECDETIKAPKKKPRANAQNAPADSQLNQDNASSPSSNPSAESTGARQTSGNFPSPSPACNIPKPYIIPSPDLALVDEEACDGCGACVDECPCECIEIVGGVATVDEDACVGCGACVDECPNDAIEVDASTSGSGNFAPSFPPPPFAQPPKSPVVPKESGSQKNQSNVDKRSTPPRSQGNPALGSENVEDELEKHGYLYWAGARLLIAYITMIVIGNFVNVHFNPKVAWIVWIALILFVIAPIPFQKRTSTSQSKETIRTKNHLTDTTNASELQTDENAAAETALGWIIFLVVLVGGFILLSKI